MEKKLIQVGHVEVLRINHAAVGCGERRPLVCPRVQVARNQQLIVCAQNQIGKGRLDGKGWLEDFRQTHLRQRTPDCAVCDTEVVYPNIPFDKWSVIRVGTDGKRKQTAGSHAW